VNLGVLSIYQPRNCQGQAVPSGFTVFYTCFLENDSAADASESYISCPTSDTTPYDVVFILSVRRLPRSHNQSTTDVTQVSGQAESEKCCNFAVNI